MMKPDSSITKIATVYLVLFCIQFIPIEGYGVDYLKFTAMTVAPIILLVKAPVFSRAVFWGGTYYLSVLLSVSMHDYFRSSTVIFLAMYLVMYALFYNLVHKGAFDVEYFKKLSILLIYSYTGCLLLQQMATLAGIHYLPLINLVNPNCSTINKLNSLGIEPSSSARILAVCFYGFLKSNEIQKGEVCNLKELWQEHRWPILAFLYSMLTMGSGTAFVGLAILSLYFIKKKYLPYIIPAAIALYFIIPVIDYEPFNRALSTADAVMTLDRVEIMAADGSAATRVLPAVNTINHLDLSRFEVWFGHGIDTARNNGIYSEENMIGCITDYGFLCFLISQIFVFVCCIRFFSLATLLYLFLMGFGGIGNIAYGWGLFMIFSVIQYFESDLRPLSVRQISSIKENVIRI